MPNRQAVSVHSGSAVVPCFQAPFPKGLVKERGLLDHESTAVVNCTTLPGSPSSVGFAIVR